MKYAVKLHMFRKAHIHTQLPGSVVNDKLIVSEFPTNMFGNEFFLQPFFLTVATIMFLAKKQGPQSGCLARNRLPITIFLLHTFPSLIGLAGILKFKEVCNGGVACSLLKLGSLKKTVIASLFHSGLHSGIIFLWKKRCHMLFWGTTGYVVF